MRLLLSTRPLSRSTLGTIKLGQFQSHMIEVDLSKESKFGGLGDGVEQGVLKPRNPKPISNLKRGLEFQVVTLPWPVWPLGEG